MNLYFQIAASLLVLWFLVPLAGGFLKTHRETTLMVANALAFCFFLALAMGAFVAIWQ